MKTKKMSKIKAVTLTELLVVLAIIALLATLAVPVYINQMQRARVATAQVETREIAEALQHVAITHGYLVPIHILDNVPDRDDNLSGNSSAQDDFDNLQGGTRYVIDVSRPLEDQTGSDQLVLTKTGPDSRVARMIEGWQGPFLNPKRVRYENEVVGQQGTGELTVDIVVDPWGNPYRVYSPFGLLGSRTSVPDGYVEDVDLIDDDLRLTTGASQVNRFDRYAVVSYGPDGDGTWSTNNPLIQNDDLYYTFSVNPGNESKYQFF